MKILHVCNGWEPGNGAANIARLIAGEQIAAGHSVVLRRWASWRDLRNADEVWIHCGWMPCLWWAVLATTLFRKKKNVHCPPTFSTYSLRWMPEACYDPVRLKYHGWKKKLVGPIERWALRRCDVLVATCEAEKEWILDYVWPCRSVERVEVTDIKRFFKLDTPIVRPKVERRLEPLHVLYLGRRHPLKGVEYLEQAVRELNDTWHKYQPNTPLPIELKIVSNAFGDEKEKVWSWCDVLCLPTLSDNLGLVIAEAIEHGRSVITTDGAPAWSDFERGTLRSPSASLCDLPSEAELLRRMCRNGERVDGCVGVGLPCRNGERVDGCVYLRGFRDGSAEKRVELLKGALKEFMD